MLRVYWCAIFKTLCPQDWHPKVTERYIIGIHRLSLWRILLHVISGHKAEIGVQFTARAGYWGRGRGFVASKRAASHSGKERKEGEGSSKVSIPSFNKYLANVKKPCDCRVLCLRLKSSTVQLCALYFRHYVIRLSWPRSCQCAPSALNVNVKKFKKARVNGESNCGSFKDSQKSLFRATLSGLRGNVHTPSIARWKALLDFLFAIIELVRSLAVETL